MQKEIKDLFMMYCGEVGLTFTNETHHSNASTWRHYVQVLLLLFCFLGIHVGHKHVLLNYSDVRSCHGAVCVGKV